MRVSGLKNAIFLLSLQVGMGCVAHATPVLTCRVTYADTTHVIDTRPTDDLYKIVPVDIGGRFTFKAVMVAQQDAIDYIKLYVNVKKPRKDMLIHLASYFPPFVLTSTPSLLTPLNYLYAGDAERGMQYQCSLQKVTP